MKEDGKIDPRKTRKISIGGPRISVVQHMVYEPRLIMAAQYSLPFIIALGMLADIEDPNIFDEKILKDREVLDFAKKVFGFEDEEMERVFPEKFASKVIVELVDGSREERVVYDSQGTPANRMTEDEMIRKFKKITQNIFDDKRLDAILEKVMKIEKMDDISELATLLG